MFDLFHTEPVRMDAHFGIGERHPGQPSAAQRSRLLDALESLGSVSTYEAMRYLDCFDRRPRILELRKAGHLITTHRVRSETEGGEVHTIGVYLKVRGGPGDCPVTQAPDGQGRAQLGTNSNGIELGCAGLDEAAQDSVTPELD